MTTRRVHEEVFWEKIHGNRKAEMEKKVSRDDPVRSCICSYPEVKSHQDKIKDGSDLATIHICKKSAEFIVPIDILLAVIKN